MDQNGFEGTLNDVTGKVEKTAGDFTGDTKLQADGLTNQGIGKVQKGFSRAREGFRNVVDDMSSQAREAASTAQEQAATIGEAIEATVHDRPLLALAAAGALGYVLAFLIHRK